MKSTKTNKPKGGYPNEEEKEGTRVDVVKSNNGINKNRLFINRILILIFTCVLFFILIQKMETEKLSVKIGDIAPVEIRASKDIVDEYATNQLKLEIRNSIEPRYRISPSIQMTMKDIINQFFSRVVDLKADESLGLQDKIDILTNESRIPITRNEAFTVVSMDEVEINRFKGIVIDIINQIMNVGVTEED